MEETDENEKIKKKNNFFVIFFMIAKKSCQIIHKEENI